MTDTSQGYQEQRGLGTREEVTHPTRREDSDKAPEKRQHLSLPMEDERMGACRSPAGKKGQRSEGRTAKLMVRLGSEGIPEGWRIRDETRGKMLWLETVWSQFP